MKRPNITPGPFELDSCGWPLIINSAEGENLATIPLPKGSTGDDEAGLRALALGEAIAALPDLLEALEFLLGHCDPLDKRHIVPTEVGSAARAALTKAGYTF